MKRQSWLVLVVVLALMGAGAAFLARRQAVQKLGEPGVKVVAEPAYDVEGKPVGSNSVYLPERVLNFTSEPEPVAKVTLGWLPKDTTYGQRIYKAPDGFSASLNVVLMGSDRTSIHKANWCLNGMGWKIDKTDLTTIPIAEPHPYDLPVMRLTTSKQLSSPSGEKTLQRGVYVYWFVADNELTPLHGQRMWWMARDMLRSGVLQRWAYVACFRPCAPGQEDVVYDRMKELIAAAVPKFQRAAVPTKALARNL
jgi:hypothetical protein